MTIFNDNKTTIYSCPVLGRQAAAGGLKSNTFKPGRADEATGIPIWQKRVRTGLWNAWKASEIVVDHLKVDDEGLPPYLHLLYFFLQQQQQQLLEAVDDPR
jgi:hypothetical protein